MTDSDAKLKVQVTAAFSVVAALAETVRALGTVPSGHLYAHVCGKLSLEQYEQSIALLVRAGLVQRSATHVLTWVPQ